MASATAPKVADGEVTEDQNKVMPQSPGGNGKGAGRVLLVLCGALACVLAVDSWLQPAANTHRGTGLFAGWSKDRSSLHSSCSDSSQWTPLGRSVYDWCSVPSELAPVLAQLFPPPGTEALPPILGAVHNFAGGIGDRTRGLTGLARMALVTGRPLAVHPDFLGLGKTYHWNPNVWPGKVIFSPWGDSAYIPLTSPVRKKPWVEVWEAMQYTKVPIAVNSNYGSFHWPQREPPPPGVGNLSDATIASLDIFDEYCGSMYTCGPLLLQAAAAHYPALSPMQDIFMEALKTHTTSQQFSAGHKSAPYSLLHVRLGGSKLTIRTADGGQAQVNAVPHYDGAMGDASVWLAAMRELTSTHPLNTTLCSEPLRIVSDSARFIGEAAFTLAPQVRVGTCCSSPQHVSRTKAGVVTTSAVSQALLDLTAIARANTAVLTSGGFGRLGRNFLSYRPPGTDTRSSICTDPKCVKASMQRLLGDLNCS